MSKLVVALCILFGSLCFCGNALGDPQILSDSELAKIRGGFDLECDGCVISFAQTFDGSSFTEVTTTTSLDQDGFSSIKIDDGITQSIMINFGSFQSNTIVQY